MTICLIAGARPNFVKIAPILRAMRKHEMPVHLVHTGQHYDQQMSGDFFEQLRIQAPDINLAVGSGTHIFQITEIMRRLEGVFETVNPSIVVVVGDVNSTLAATLTAVKLGMPTAHVEAGLRSGDRSMPEEINRVIVDGVCDPLFVSEPSGAKNLSREGIPAERIHNVGNVMIDTLFANIEQARQLDVCNKYGVEAGEFAFLTLHRPSNVDNKSRLREILRAVNHLAQTIRVLFPLHPRTQARIKEYGFENEPSLLGFRQLSPCSYLETLGLVDRARLVLTDSGGLQEETTALRVPCLTLRDNTERPITITEGSNQLVGWEFDRLESAIQDTLAGPLRIGRIPDLWDGHAAERICATLKRYV